MAVPLIQVDAFTDRKYRGNPAAVCLLEEAATDEWMQDVAREMNLSETAFLRQADDGFSLRWFTPAAEVDLCGHATLASAHVLWQLERIEPSATARFHTKSGLLTADRRDEWIEMDFPAEPVADTGFPPELARGLGVSMSHVAKNRLDYLVELRSAGDLRGLRPDFGLLASLGTRGVIVTALADDPAHDFVSRYFAPRFGIDEDPVTGSAHCALGPYWGDKLDKQELVGYQASARGGIVRVRLAGERVKLLGQAVTVMHGELV